MVSTKIHRLKNHIYPTIPKSIMKIFRLRSPKFLKRDCAFRKSMKSHLNYKKKKLFSTKTFLSSKNISSSYSIYNSKFINEHKISSSKESLSFYEKEFRIFILAIDIENKNIWKYSKKSLAVNFSKFLCISDSIKWRSNWIHSSINIKINLDSIKNFTNLFIDLNL